MLNNSARPEADPRYAAVRPVSTVPRRRSAVVLALLIALLTAGVAPAMAAGRVTAEAGRVTTTAAVAASQQSVYRHGSYHSTTSKSVVAGKKSTSRRSNSKTGMKGLVGFLVLLLFFGLLFGVLLIWVVIRTKRRAALEQRNG